MYSIGLDVLIKILEGSLTSYSNISIKGVIDLDSPQRQEREVV